MSDAGQRLERFRYRTSVLAGPWRPTRREAANDAVRAGQALLDSGRLHWRCSGWIEAREETRSPEAEG